MISYAFVYLVARQKPSDKCPLTLAPSENNPYDTFIV